MSLRFHLCSLLLLCLAFGSLTACDSDHTVTAPSPAVTSFGAPALFGFEPATLRPELVGGNSCATFQPFSTHVTIVVSTEDDVIVRSLHFRFTDRFGVTALPSVSSNPTSPIPTPTSSAIPPLGVAPLPTSSPIPIPNATPITGFMVPARSRHRLPFLLTFGCGVRHEGTLGVSVDSADMRGRLQTSQLQAQVMP
jgi:hypothetical protein